MSLSSTSAAVRDALGATADVASAVVSAGFLVGLPLAVAVDLLDGPVPESVVPAGALLAGGAAAYVFVAGSPPLALLTDFALAAILGLVGFGAVAFVVVGALGGFESGSTADAVSRVATVMVAYASGAVYVTARRRRHASGTRAGERSA